MAVLTARLRGAPEAPPCLLARSSLVSPGGAAPPGSHTPKEPPRDRTRPRSVRAWPRGRPEPGTGHDRRRRGRVSLRRRAVPVAAPPAVGHSADGSAACGACLRITRVLAG